MFLFTFPMQTMVRLSKLELSDFIVQIIDSYQGVCRSKQIKLTLDIEDVSVGYEPKMVRRAVELMMDNSVQVTPVGGEIEASLINAEYQWELEIADSGPRAKTDRVATEAQTELPKIVGESPSTSIKSLQQLSVLMNATVQSWNCPLGGTAIVLVIPKGHTNEQAITKAA